MMEDSYLELFFLGDRRAYFNGKPLLLSQKWADILALLALHPEGLSGEALLAGGYGEAGCMTTLKVTLSRMRHVLPLSSRPYRFDGNIRADFLEVETLLSQGNSEEALRLYKGNLLPCSQAPAVAEHRNYLEELMRQSILANKANSTITKPFFEDLAIWEAFLENLSANDKRYPFAKTKVAWLRRDWGLPPLTHE
jgi:hypothetical protein